jgi:hemoglobin-like flavoprotein
MKNYLEFFMNSLYRVWGEPGRQDDFLSHFYQVFTSKTPLIADYFSDTDMSRQKDMLAQSLHEIVEFSTTRVASERLQHVAIRHSRKERGIAPELYEEWLESLIQTVREFDLEFTDEVELSWRVVLSPGITYMKFRYDHF